MKHAFSFLLIALLNVAGTSCSIHVGAGNGKIASLQNEVAQLRAECQALRLMLAEPAANRVNVKQETPETELLRAECQQLRLLLAMPSKPKISQPANNPQDTVPVETEHWLTTPTGVRHNMNCPNYQQTVGRPCAPDEGRACRICGG